MRSNAILLTIIYPSNDDSPQVISEGHFCSKSIHMSWKNYRKYIKKNDAPKNRLKSTEFVPI